MASQFYFFMFINLLAISIEAKELVYLLQGEVSFGGICQLAVLEESQDPNDYWVIAATSFSHEDSNPGLFKLVPSYGQLEDYKENGKLLVVVEDVDSILKAQKYAVFWKHDDHFDPGFCNNLKQVDTAEWTGEDPQALLNAEERQPESQK